jgi:hypothetical protein
MDVPHSSLIRWFWPPPTSCSIQEKVSVVGNLRWRSQPVAHHRHKQRGQNARPIRGSGISDQKAQSGTRKALKAWMFLILH